MSKEGRTSKRIKRTLWSSVLAWTLMFLEFSQAIAFDEKAVIQKNEQKQTVNIEVLFAPPEDCELAIIKNIKDSTKTIDVAVYSINNEGILKALDNAKKRKVNIRILTDNGRSADKTSKAIHLYDQGFNLRLNSHRKVMHNKFAVFDEKKIVTGSFNWTVPASKVNDENCLFLDDEATVKTYRNQFEKLWMINTEEESLKKINERRKNKN